MFSGILDFLFGKSAKIFDKDGQVRHQLAKDKWDAWQARYLKGEEYNWRQHTGTRAKPNEPKLGPSAHP